MPAGARNRADVREPDDVAAAVNARRPNDAVRVVVVREGERRTLTVKLGEQPDEAALARGNRSGKSGGDNGATEEKADNVANTGLVLGDLTDELVERFGLEKGVKGAIVKEVDRLTEITETL